MVFWPLKSSEHSDKNRAGWRAEVVAQLIEVPHSRRYGSGIITSQASYLFIARLSSAVCGR